MPVSVKIGDKVVLPEYGGTKLVIEEKVKFTLQISYHCFCYTCIKDTNFQIVCSFVLWPVHHAVFFKKSNHSFILFLHAFCSSYYFQYTEIWVILMIIMLVLHIFSANVLPPVSFFKMHLYNHDVLITLVSHLPWRLWTSAYQVRISYSQYCDY